MAKPIYRIVKTITYEGTQDWFNTIDESYDHPLHETTNCHTPIQHMYINEGHVTVKVSDKIRVDTLEETHNG